MSIEDHIDPQIVDLYNLVPPPQRDAIGMAAAIAADPFSAAGQLLSRSIERLEPRTKRLQDGTTGYFVRGQRTDDCFAAAIATTLQVPIDDVPDPRIAERLDAGEPPEEINRTGWEALCGWLARRGLTVAKHDDIPLAEGRWIGMVATDRGLRSHCLCMLGPAVLFDPVESWIYKRPVRRFGASEIDYGLSFEPITYESSLR